MEHTLGVAKYVAGLKLDDTSIYAALLHEVIKYDEYNEEDMLKASSKEVVNMVNTLKRLPMEDNKKLIQEVLALLILEIFLKLI